MANIIDPVFGEMEVKHGWQKKETIRFWDKSVNFKIKAAQYANTGITEIQRKSYQTTLDNITAVSEKAKKAIEDYIKHNKGAIESSLSDMVLTEVEKLVSPRSMVFFADGKYGILFDCIWDSEHGMAVTLPDYQVGPQDILL
jgi:DNA-binding protein Fis